MYKGKFHLVRPTPPVGGNYTQADLAAYGYARWNPPDAGADQSLPEGGGNPLGGGDNDFRCARAAGVARQGAWPAPLLPHAPLPRGSKQPHPNRYPTTPPQPTRAAS